MAKTRRCEERKRIPLRISKSLYDELAVWADEDYRSVNSQIEAILSNCVKERKSNLNKYQTQ